MQLLDPSHPFFTPLWRRIAVVATCAIWTVVEFTVGTPIWGAGVAALGAFAAWKLLITYTPPEE